MVSSKRVRKAGVYLRNVREIREQAGISRDKLAYSASVSSRTIAKVEKGEAPTQRLVANKIFNALHKISSDLKRADIIYEIRPDGEEVEPVWD